MDHYSGKLVFHFHHGKFQGVSKGPAAAAAAAVPAAPHPSVHHHHHHLKKPAAKAVAPLAAAVPHHKKKELQANLGGDFSELDSLTLHSVGDKGNRHQPGNVDTLLKQAKYYPGDRNKAIPAGASQPAGVKHHHAGGAVQPAGVGAVPAGGWFGGLVPAGAAQAAPAAKKHHKDAEVS
eukprot:Hpha_TRINITY_DN16266_c5_g1::TRINITY_DN16266_c5_g1_i1::g.11659::m.11659